MVKIEIDTGTGVTIHSNMSLLWAGKEMLVPEFSLMVQSKPRPGVISTDNKSPEWNTGWNTNPLHL
eukprot:scaffold24640_cov68-Cyclotella_meneghiniana.AAC.9